RLDKIGQRDRGDELRWLLNIYGVCVCDACTDARVRRIAELREGASIDVQSFVSDEFEEFAARFRSLEGTIALVETAEGSREVDLRDAMIWPGSDAAPAK